MTPASPILTAEQMRRCDEYTIQNGVPSHVLMERAAAALVRALNEHTELFLDNGQVLVLCGGGNNGGDGFAAARQLATGTDCQKRPVAVLFLGRLTMGDAPDESRMSDECAKQYRLATAAGVPVYVPDDDTDALLHASTAVIDAVFGIGLERPVTGTIAHVFEQITELGLPVLSADIPSGVSADTGDLLGRSLPARLTVTMQALKPGLLLYPGADLCGRLIIADLGIHTVIESHPYAHLADDSLLSFVLPPRRRRSNKSDYGRLALVCGEIGMAGAAILATSAALRSGVGLARVVTPEGNRTILQTALPEAVLTLYDNDLPALPPADGYVVGCGLGRSERALELLTLVLDDPAPVPLVLDADALNLLASHPALWQSPRLTDPRRQVVLTPHPAEMARLTGLSVSDVLRDLPRVAAEFAALHGVTVVLKDAHTVIAAPDGTLYISAAGNAGMATGGTGDALAGVIGSLLVQSSARLSAGELSVVDVAAAGVYLHGAAGDLCATRLGELGMLPSDLIRALPDVTRELSHSAMVPMIAWPEI